MGNQFQSKSIEEDLNVNEIDMKWPYVVLICINILTIMPISIKMSYRYYKMRENYLYNARRPYLVTIFNIVAIIFIGIYTPLHIAIMEIYWDNNAKYDEWWDSLSFFTAQIFVFIAFALRTWHSFYDFKLAQSASNREWKSILNEKYKSDYRSFFLKYHQSLGNPRKTFLYFLIIPTLLFIIAFSVIIANKTGYNIEYFCLFCSFCYLFGIIFILLYIIYHSALHVYDNIHLRGEILIGCVVLCITVFLETIIQIIDMYRYNEQNERYQQVFNFCFFVISDLACLILIIVSTQYVRIKVSKNERISEQLLSKNELTTPENQRNGDDERWILQNEVDFETLIFTSDGLFAFLDHLGREFQLNYLVFAMEVTQYKSCVIPTLQRSKTYIAVIAKLESSMLTFARGLPKSSIIFPINGKATTDRRMFIELFEKYIDDSAQWKIKIGAQHKNELVELYRRCKMSRTKAFSVFDGNNTTILSLDTLRTPPDDDIAIDHLPAISTMHSLGTRSTINHGMVDPKDLKAMVEALDNALNDVIELLKKSFDKYKQTERFSVWFAQLTPKKRNEITRKFNRRKNVKNAIKRLAIARDDKEWTCNHCRLVNRAITINNKLSHPKNICRCCGELNSEKTDDVITTTTKRPQQKTTKHTESMKDSLVLNQIMSHIVEDTVEINDDPDFEHDIIRIQSVQDAVNGSPDERNFVLDEQIVKEWNELLIDIEENEDENICNGVNSEYVDSCPKVQKLAFVMRCYQYYLGKTCKIDEDDEEPKQYAIKSMSELIHGLKDLNLQSLLDIYEHVSTEHFNSELFEYFNTTIGKCEGGNNCKPLSRNRRQRNVNDDIDDPINIDEEKEEETFEPIRPRRRVLNEASDIEYIGNDGKIVNNEERIALSYLDKWHSFLFHPNITELSKLNEQNDQNEDDIEDEFEVEEVEEFDIVRNIESKGNKFVTDVSKCTPGNLSKLISMSSKAFSNSITDETCYEEEEYYEYGFGSQIKYHTLSSPNFVCLKDELLGNEIYVISEKTWNDNLSKALLYLEMECVQTNFKANDHGNAKEYGITQNDPINIDNVIAILFYCNFDILQNEFSKTFRRQSPLDSEYDIIQRHIQNFYWLGRALFVAISFYGKRMSKDCIVYHGLSSKMLFEDFATYFDCPTSTTTERNVAQTFSGNGSGIILRLKSKHSVNCAYMLNVSVFSDFTDEQERLFLNETLIITDILCIENQRWVSCKKYIGAYKITTGHSLDEDWNIRESKKIQETLAQIILDYMTDGNIAVKVPNYIRILFGHYCMKHDKPLFNGIDKIQYKMAPKLQQLFFDQSIISKEQYKDNGAQKIATKKVKELFPNCKHFINDQGQLISMEDGVEIVRKQTTLSPAIKPIRKGTLRLPSLYK